MCSVKVAVHEPTGAEVAVKVMNKDDIRNKDLTVSVRREVAIMKALRHKNIVSLHRVLSSSTRLYIIMDLVYGSDLEHHIAEAEKAGVSLSEDKVRIYFRHIVDGVVHCHERRVYHRDLKVRLRVSRWTTCQGCRWLRCVNSPWAILNVSFGASAARPSRGFLLRHCSIGPFSVLCVGVVRCTFAAADMGILSVLAPPLMS